ncbi:MAG: hypothetical protein RQ745_09450 [Longimicrobiales bacterium]|nr:hypothetical protein [Longimicrobiales bacterium]
MPKERLEAYDFKEGDAVFTSLRLAAGEMTLEEVITGIEGVVHDHACTASG